MQDLKGKLTSGLKNDIRNLTNFNVSSCMSENLPFDWNVLSNTFKDLNERVQKNYVS